MKGGADDFIVPECCGLVWTSVPMRPDFPVPETSITSDGIPVEERHPRIAEYLQDTYELAIDINSTQILRRKRHP